MQTRDFANALESVVEQLDLERMSSLLRPLTMAEGKAIPETTKQEFDAWLIRNILKGGKLKGENDEKILEAFSLSWLLDPNPFVTIAVDFKNSHDWPTLAGTKLGKRLKDMIAMTDAMKRLSGIVDELLIKPSLEGLVPTQDELFIVRVRDFDGNGVPLERLNAVIAAIAKVAAALDRNTAPRIQFLDSGSDVAVGIKLTKMALGLPALFLSLFDLSLLRRVNRHNLTIDSIVKSADGMAHIRDLVESNRVTREDGGAMIAAIRSGMTELLKNGAYPDSKTDAEADALRLPNGRPQGLLTAGSTHDNVDLSDVTETPPPV